MSPMPGFGDYDRFPVIDPRDPRATDDELALEFLTDSITDLRMQRADYVSDAALLFSDADHAAMVAAAVDGDQLEIGRLYVQAVRRAIRLGAERDARSRLHRLRREEEDEAAIERAGA